MPPPVLFTDADNTLWDTDALFASAQLAVLAAVEAESGRSHRGDDRLAFVRRVDQALAERHHAGLRYPPRLLAQGIALALSDMPPGQAARTAVTGQRQRSALADMGAAAIEEDFLAAVGRLPSLRQGVAEGLEELRAAGWRVFVITEASRMKVARLAERLGISGFLERIIESPKRPELYRRVLKLAASPQRPFMVGDQLTRDIAPAKAAGLETIWFPGGFRPSWEPQAVSVKPDHVVTNFMGAAEIVVESGGSGLH